MARGSRMRVAAVAGVGVAWRRPRGSTAGVADDDDAGSGSPTSCSGDRYAGTEEIAKRRKGADGQVIMAGGRIAGVGERGAAATVGVGGIDGACAEADPGSLVAVEKERREGHASGHWTRDLIVVLKGNGGDARGPSSEGQKVSPHGKDVLACSVAATAAATASVDASGKAAEKDPAAAGTSVGGLTAVVREVEEGKKEGKIEGKGEREREVEKEGKGEGKGEGKEKGEEEGDEEVQAEAETEALREEGAKEKVGIERKGKVEEHIAGKGSSRRGKWAMLAHIDVNIDAKGLADIHADDRQKDDPNSGECEHVAKRGIELRAECSQERPGGKPAEDGSNLFAGNSDTDMFLSASTDCGEVSAAKGSNRVEAVRKPAREVDVAFVGSAVVVVPGGNAASSLPSEVTAPVTISVGFVTGTDQSASIDVDAGGIQIPATAGRLSTEAPAPAAVSLMNAPGVTPDGMASPGGATPPADTPPPVPVVSLVAASVPSVGPLTAAPVPRGAGTVGRAAPLATQASAVALQTPPGVAPMVVRMPTWEDADNEMNIPCVLCGVRFRKPGHLNMHWRSVHAPRPNHSYPAGHGAVSMQRSGISAEIGEGKTISSATAPVAFLSDAGGDVPTAPLVPMLLTSSLSPASGPAGAMRVPLAGSTHDLLPRALKQKRLHLGDVEIAPANAVSGVGGAPIAGGGVGSRERQKSHAYGCPHCEARFRRGSDRNRHMRMVHERRRPFSCDKCCKHFGRKSFLEAHISTVHKKERPYCCATCRLSFGQRSSLTRHARKLHGLGANEVAPTVASAPLTAASPGTTNVSAAKFGRKGLPSTAAAVPVVSSVASVLLGETSAPVVPVRKPAVVSASVAGSERMTQSRPAHDIVAAPPPARCSAQAPCISSAARPGADPTPNKNSNTTPPTQPCSSPSGSEVFPRSVFSGCASEGVQASLIGSISNQGPAGASEDSGARVSPQLLVATPPEVVSAPLGASLIDEGPSPVPLGPHTTTGTPRSSAGGTCANSSDPE